MNETRKINVMLTGPNFFCPDCRRWLATSNADGSFDIASKARIEAAVRLRGGEDEAEGLVVEAICLRRRCTRKRRRRGEEA